MAVVVSKSAGLNDDLWNEWAPLIRSYISDADKQKNDYKEILGKIFNVEKSDRFGEKNTGLTEFADFMITGEGGNAVLDDLQETYPKLIEHVELMKKFVVTKTLAEDSKVNVLKQQAKNFVNSYYRSRLQFATNALIADGTTFTYGGVSTLDRTTGDGKALFAVDHPGKKAGVSAQSNLFTNAFTEDALSLGGSAIRNFQNDSGNVMGYTANKIIIPGNTPNLEKEIRILIASELRPGTSDNDVNIEKGKYELVVNPLWQAGAGEEPWILMSDEANTELQGNMFFDRTDLQMKEQIDIDTHNLQYSGRFRMGVGFFNWRHIAKFGVSTGTTLA